MKSFASLKKALCAPSDRVPKGFYTSEQLAKKWNCSVRTAQKTCRDSVAAKLAIMKEFRVWAAGRKSCVPVPHYRFK